MAYFRDITGRRFGRWIVLECVGRNKHKKPLWRVRCDCGNEATLNGSHHLLAGKSQSCGCLRIEAIQKHGLTSHPIYSVWEGMKYRCLNPKATGFSSYGGRGITVCEEWLDDPKAFITWSLNNGYASELQLDRIDNNGPYAPWNCRYVTRKINTNNRRQTRMVTVKGELLALTDAYEKYGVAPLECVRWRLRVGWDAERALLTPSRIHA